jgi:hypothetical protein
MKIFDDENGRKFVKVIVTIDVWVGDDVDGIIHDTPEKVLESLEGKSRKDLGQKVMEKLDNVVIVNE